MIVSGVLAARGTLLFLERIPINAIPAELASFFLPAGFGFAPRLGLFAALLTLPWVSWRAVEVRTPLSA